MCSTLAVLLLGALPAATFGDRVVKLNDAQPRSVDRSAGGFDPFNLRYFQGKAQSLYPADLLAKSLAAGDKISGIGVYVYLKPGSSFGGPSKVNAHRAPAARHQWGGKPRRRDLQVANILNARLAIKWLEGSTRLSQDTLRIDPFTGGTFKQYPPTVRTPASHFPPPKALCPVAGPTNIPTADIEQGCYYVMPLSSPEQWDGTKHMLLEFSWDNKNSGTPNDLLDQGAAGHHRSRTSDLSLICPCARSVLVPEHGMWSKAPCPGFQLISGAYSVYSYQ
eukprot:gene2839-3438_t